ncbi:hypothetical protein J4Q44_G00353630 [Coregonus suidteri]|uniref:Uncharacterized protein n=1 Tax=Coregonus suidteri TaxID=861788 RepID=A0AAN8KMU8_9TELE
MVGLLTDESWLMSLEPNQRAYCHTVDPKPISVCRTPAVSLSQGQTAHSTEHAWRSQLQHLGGEQSPIVQHWQLRWA